MALPMTLPAGVPTSALLRGLVAGSLLAALALPANAADWLTVARDRLRVVELDTASITAAENDTKVAWGRIVLSDAEARNAGYKMVRAMNRYDCRNSSFVIVKRVYLADDSTTLREEQVDAKESLRVRPGTVDDRFFNEVCKPATAKAAGKQPTVADLQKVAREAAGRVQALDTVKTQPDAAIRRADIQLARDEAPAAPATPPAHPSTKPAPPAPATPPVHALPTLPKTMQPAARPAEKADKTEAAAAAAASKIEIGPDGTVRAAPRPPRPTPVPTSARAAEARAAQMPYTAPARPAALAMSAPAVKPAEPARLPERWSYEGEGSPENWGRLSPQNALCMNGQRQSPIDVRDSIKVEQEPLQFDYQPSYFRIVDNGHTIQVSYGAGSSLSVMGRRYELQSLHFNHPGEGRINGQSFEMTAQLVHRDAEGRQAVVLLPIQRGDTPQSFVQTLWNNLPLEKNEAYQPAVSINANDLLPARRGYISFMGSLTTPPCSEGVLWIVMKQPVVLTADQIGVFARFYPNNARPLQPLAGRTIKESR
ncbi:carbonic anhydrase [Uliginosibacterium sp. H1]|uniref:carbonic anhydrase n=1 Tax=Uliginosibacterium sp. H1 TaxID=3114757 RepID=UPI002E199D59|nr:carbonic anhydrase family protein [Uliginosibacterium sp. H1]